MGSETGMVLLCKQEQLKRKEERPHLLLICNTRAHTFKTIPGNQEHTTANFQPVTFLHVLIFY